MLRSVALIFLIALLAPATSRAGTVTLSPSADTFVRAAAPQANYGGADYLDSQGGLATAACGADGQRVTGPAYTYLKFDLSQIPAGAKIQSTSLELTSRSGFAGDGDSAQYVRYIGDDAWTESGLTYANQPFVISFGWLAARDISYGAPQCGDPKGDPRPQPFTGEALTDQVSAEHEGDGTLSLEVFGTNCADCGNQGAWVRFFSREAANPAVRPQLVVTYEDTSPPDGTPPVLYSVIPDATANSTTVVGRLAGAPSTTYSLQFYRGTQCVDGVLGGERSTIGSDRVTTDATGSGYFARVLDSNLPAGSYVAVSADGSALSRCVLAPDNDTWPRALPTASQTGSGMVSQSLDYDGQARWYRLDVAPDSQVTLDLDGLPANYDLFVFKDIAQALNSVSSDQDLLKLSAEFATANSAPSAFSPSAFSPSAFSPSAFSPSAFSPSAFSPSAFSPSAFSPSAFSPSAFSPSAFSPSAFSPSAFSPSAFSPDAYASAQVRSLIGGSTNEGDAAEHVTLNSWGNTTLYVRINGRNGASAAGKPFHLRVTSDAGSCTGVAPIGSAPSDAAGGAFKTIILGDVSRMSGTAAEKAAMQAKLVALAARPEVAGKIVDLAQSPRVVALNAQADTHPACPYAKNLVASAIKDIVDSYRAANPLAYVVAVGNDSAVPFFRYPDTAGLGPESEYVPPVIDASASQASLRRNYVLSQDAYGAKTEISLGMGSLPIPDLAVGRLAEQPASISAVLDAYLGTSDGVAPTPKSSLVTGYDFLTDAAQAVQQDFAAGLGAGGKTDTLITDANVPPSEVGDPPSKSWDANRLRTALLGSRHDLIYLAGHFSANNALAADYATTMDATELAASSVNLKNTLVAGAGCHSGYNIVDEDAIPGVTVPLDWVEAFAQKGATMVAGTGYQYGDTDFLEYSERLYSDFSSQLRVGTGAVPVGRALVKAKQEYLAGTPVMRGIHAKALLEATLYGLPMLGFDLPSGRVPEPSSSSIVSATTPFSGKPGSELGLTYADVPLAPDAVASQKVLDNLAGGGTTTATWWTGPSGVLTNPGEPALPLARYDVSVPGRVARGVAFRGGTFITPLTGTTPLTGGATTEKQAVHTPFAPSVWFPLRPWSLNYFGALAGGSSTYLNVTPVQYRADAPGAITSTARRFTNLDLRVYYSAEKASYPTGAGNPPNTPALAAPPSIASVSHEVDGSDIHFRVKVVGDPSAGIQEVWVVYQGVHAGKWEPLDLHQDATDSTLWTGTLTAPVPGDVKYVVQAVNGVGLVGSDDNFGAYYSVERQTTAPAGTSLTLSSPASGVFRSSSPVTAVLLDASGAPVAGRQVAFSVGAVTRVATTDAAGRATASVPLTDNPGDYRLTAAFAGDAAFEAASDSRATFTIERLPSALALSADGSVATLTAGGEPLISQTVLFVLSRADGSTAASVARFTDVGGRARLGFVDVAPGTYTVKAYFGGTVGAIALGDPTPYTTASASGTLVACFTGCTQVPGTVGGYVPPTLALSLGAPATFGAFAPGVDRTYTAATTANVISTAGDATLTVDGGRLSNGAFTLSEPLQIAFSKSAWTAPVSNDVVSIALKQHIGANEPLRTGAYSKVLTFTLSTTSP